MTIPAAPDLAQHLPSCPVPRQPDQGRQFLTSHPLQRLDVDGSPGFAITVRMPSYRSLPLSCIVRIHVTVDRAEVDADRLRLRLAGLARSVSRRHMRQGLEAGIPAELVDRVIVGWNDNLSLEEAYEIAGNPPADSGLTAWVGMIWDNFGHSEPAALASIMPYVVHFHGKFFHVDDGDEPDLRYGEVVAELVRSGYNGWISSEYEGDAEDSFAVVAAHQAMIRRHAAVALTSSS